MLITNFFTTMKNLLPLLAIIMLAVLGSSLLSSCQSISHADNAAANEDDQINGDISYLIGDS